MNDLSNGYDAAAENFIAARSLTTGVTAVRSWARRLAAGARVLEIGCGDGIPLSRVLIQEGLDVYAADASPKMVSAFRRNFPDTMIVQQAAEELKNFENSFDAALAWGLLFLVKPDAQKVVIANVAAALHEGGKFLFTAPQEASVWTDIQTGRESISLGADEYRSILAAANLTIIAQFADEDGNHYYEAEKRAVV